jgi:hypothetical protein
MNFENKERRIDSAIFPPPSFRQILLDKTNQNKIPNKICINSSFINRVNFNENNKAMAG